MQDSKDLKLFTVLPGVGSSVSRRMAKRSPRSKSTKKMSTMWFMMGSVFSTVHRSFLRTPAPGSDGTQNVMMVRSESPTAPATATHLSGSSVGSLAPHTYTQSLISVMAMIVMGVTAPSSKSMKKGDLVVTCIKRIRNTLL